MGPGLDNNVVGKENCPKDYLMVEMAVEENNSKCGEFFKTFQKILIIQLILYHLRWNTIQIQLILFDFYRNKQ